MNVNKRKKKCENFLTKQFYIDNQGDVFCTILISIMSAQMVTFLRPYSQPFAFINHLVNNTDKELHFNRIYEYGRLDICSVFSSTILWLVILSAIEEYITDKFLPRLHLSLTKTYELRLGIFAIPFSIFCMIHQFYSLIVTEKYKVLSNFFLPQQNMNMHTKISIILGLGYYLASIIKLHVSRTSAKNGNIFVRFWVLQFSYIFLLYNLKFYDFAVFTMALTGIINTFEILYSISLSIPSFYLYRKIGYKMIILSLFLCTVVSLFAAFISFQQNYILILNKSYFLAIMNLIPHSLLLLYLVYYLLSEIINCTKFESSIKTKTMEKPKSIQKSPTVVKQKMKKKKD